MDKNILAYKDFNSFTILLFLFTGISFFLLIGIIYTIDYDVLHVILDKNHAYTKLVDMGMKYFDQKAEGSVLKTIGISSIGLIVAYTTGVVMYVLGILVISFPATLLFEIKKILKKDYEIDKALEFSAYSSKISSMNINSKMIYMYLLIRNSGTPISKEMKLMFDMLMFGRAILTSLVIAFLSYAFVAGKIWMSLSILYIATVAVYLFLLVFVDRILYLSVLIQKDDIFEEKSNSNLEHVEKNSKRENDGNNDKN